MNGDDDRRPNMRPLRKDPPTFADHDNENWLSFRISFLKHVTLNSWSDHNARLMLDSSVIGNAAIAVAGLGPSNYENLTQMLDAFEGRFMPMVASRAVQTQFETATIAPDEPVARFHGRLRALFIRAYPQRAAELEQDQILIRRFMTGLASPEETRTVAATRPTTFTKALEAAQDARALDDLVAMRPGNNQHEMNAAYPAYQQGRRQGQKAGFDNSR